MVIKLIRFGLVFSFLFAYNFFAQAQLKNRELKVPKEVRKEAKKLKKKGWINIPGALPLQNQLEDAWYKQKERDEEGYPKWIHATGNGVGQSQTAAKIQAVEVAKLELGGVLQTEIKGLVESSIANQQLNTEEAASLTKVIAGAKNIISASLGRIIIAYEAMKSIEKQKTVEVQVRIFYNQKLAMEQAKKIIQNNLEEGTEEIHQKLDNILGLNN